MLARPKSQREGTGDMDAEKEEGEV